MSSSFCSATDTCLPRTAAIAWGLTRHARQARHDRHRTGTCRGAAPFGPADLAARLPRQACESTGCVDLFMDVWLHAHSAMHTRFAGHALEETDTALAYFNTAARAQLQEIGRRGRAMKGGVAKPQRNDGVIGRVARSFDDPWLTDVFRFLLGYVASAGGEADSWPLDVLAARKSNWDGRDRPIGSAAARAELRADVEACLDVVRRVAGDGWLYECLLLPLANRGGTASLPDDLERIHVGSSVDAEVDGVTTVLQDLVRRTRSGASPQVALRSAVAAWLGDDPCPAEWARRSSDDLAVRRLAKALIAELTLELKAA
jgi:hypothetical protein